MLNFVICDDNINILDKLPKMLENIFAKHGYDACIGLKSDDFNEVLDYVDEPVVVPEKKDVKTVPLEKNEKKEEVLVKEDNK